MFESPDQLLEDVQLTLENDSRWYKWCNTRGVHDNRPQLKRASCIHFYNAMKYFYTPAEHLSMDQQAYLRVYFTWRYLTDQKTPAPEYTAGGLKQRPSPLTSLTVTPEKSMSLKFTPQFLLNGVDIKTMAKADIYAAIEAEEQRIEKLGKIKNQPKSLVAEIEQAEATLKALVEHLDNN